MNQSEIELAMRALAAKPENATPLPDADLVWQRAAVRARLRQYELATRWIRVVEWMVVLVCTAAGGVALLALRPGIEAILGAMDPLIVSFAGMALAATAVVALVLFRTMLAEE